MGLLRFLLAGVVVIFHLGGGGMLTGRLAVMGFYVISGYLIVRVFKEHYRSWSGAVRFAVNRALRLYPLYIVLVILSWLAYTYVGPVAREPAPEGNTWLPTHPVLAWREFLLFPSLEFNDFFPRLLGNGGVIPQSWSIQVEAVFYLIPLLALFAPFQVVMAVAALASFSYFAYVTFVSENFANYDNMIYKEALATAWFFAVGGLTYLNRNRLRSLIPAWLSYRGALVGLVLLLLGLAGNRYLGFQVETNSGGWRTILVAVNLAVAAGVVLVVLTADERENPLGHSLGELSYGMYLNHLLVGWAMMWFSGAVGFHIFGRPHDLSFGVMAVAFSAAFALVTYRFVETPVQKVRSLVRTSRPAAAPMPGDLEQQTPRRPRPPEQPGEFAPNPSDFAVGRGRVVRG